MTDIIEYECNIIVQLLEDYKKETFENLREKLYENSEMFEVKKYSKHGLLLNVKVDLNVI